jgi:hypothetical protein
VFATVVAIDKDGTLQLEHLLGHGKGTPSGTRMYAIGDKIPVTTPLL